MVYNLTQIGENATGLLGFVKGVNVVLLDGYLGILFLIGIAVVIWAGFMHSTNDAGKSLGATGFILFSLTILLRLLGLVSDLVLFIVFFIAAASIAVIWKSS